MQLNKEQIELIFTTLGSLRNPPYKRFVEKINAQDEFSEIKITVSQLKYLHGISKTHSNKDIADFLLKELENSSLQTLMEVFSKKEKIRLEEKKVKNAALRNKNSALREKKEKAYDESVGFPSNPDDNYMIVTDRDPLVIVSNVNRFMKKGWIPVGGITIVDKRLENAPDGSIQPIQEYYFLQSMIKKNDVA